MEQFKTLASLKAYIFNYVSKLIILDKLDFIEAKFFNIQGRKSMYVVFGALNYKFSDNQQQRVTYDVCNDAFEISIHYASRSQIDYQAMLNNDRLKL